MDLSKNAARFSGFADAYEEARPTAPLFPVDVVMRYLGRSPRLVVDLGCGTGLSSRIWEGRCRELVGIDPSEDMLAVARRKSSGNARFLNGYGNAMPLPDGCADAVLCFQAFHWMEPVSTLAEVDRVLKPGGVFAAVTYDWPCVMHWEAEEAFRDLWNTVARIERDYADVRASFNRFEKSKHLENIQKSGVFRYVREIVFANDEPCTADRMVRMAESIGGYRTVKRMHPELVEGVFEHLKETLHRVHPEPFTASFCYRMRVGIK